MLAVLIRKDGDGGARTALAPGAKTDNQDPPRCLRTGKKGAAAHATVKGLGQRNLF